MSAKLQDVIWGGGRELVAGQTALKQFVQDTRVAYPDMVIEAVDIATADLSGGGRCVRHLSCGVAEAIHHMQQA